MTDLPLKKIREGQAVRKLKLEKEKENQKDRLNTCEVSTHGLTKTRSASIHSRSTPLK